MDKPINGYYEASNPNGPVLAMAQPKFLHQDGLVFKDLAGTGELVPYADWRLSPKERAKDLASRMDVAQIAGLMLFSPHQMVPFRPGSHFVGHYEGKDFDPEQHEPDQLTDEQKHFLTREHIRNVLLTKVDSARVAASWNNRLQAQAEALPLGIPVMISSDPRHAAGSKSAEFSSAGRDISRWPEGMGFAATFSPELVKEFAAIASKEYRALGITMALGPQIDLATEPRWMRWEDTMGPQADMTVAFTRAYCDGMQTTEGTPDGWGKDSVATMVKHWPGGGSGEGGRDAHYVFGKYGVFPGGKLREHMRPFTEGAFHLDGPTGKAAAVMPYYTISHNQDTKYGENVGNSYSRYMISDLLREEAGFDGVVCTDWGITGEPHPDVNNFNKRCHGVEHLSEAEQHLKLLCNGIDQFGGNSSIAPVLQAYEMGCRQMGEAAMRERMEQSAVRLLTVMFRLGLFEHPYLDPVESEKILGAEEYVQAGLAAQRRSVVLLKDQNALPLKRGMTLYVPERHIDQHFGFIRFPEPAVDLPGLTQQEAEGWFRLTDDPSQADAAVVFAESPISDGYDPADRAAGGNGYVPISLQYRPYVAENARKASLASGDPREVGFDRNYHGKTGKAANEQDLDNILHTRAVMGDKPVIVCMRLHNPMVMGEFEAAADGIIAHFGVEKQVLMEILTGEAQPGGRLPMAMPKNMAAVEQHCEDVFDDIEPYVDSCGNVYGYGFGLKAGK